MRQSHGGGQGGISQRAKVQSVWRNNILWLLTSIGVLVAAFPVKANTTYLYDANSRLLGVLNTSGNSTRYVYDDIGNLVRTDSIPSSQLMVLGFAPEHGAVSSAVTIWGQGFSTTTSANAVSFNGTAATVTSATANQLQVTVPSGATTGPLSITTGGNTTASLNPFTVDDSGIAPTLTSVSPTIGVAGTVVTLTGTHLDPVAGGTTVTLNGVSVVPTTLTDNTISFTTPTAFGSGKFLVTTLYGQVTAASDFTTIAPDFASYTISTGRIAINGATVNVKATSEEGVTELLFDAPAGTWLSLQGSGLPNSESAEIELYDPRGLVIGAQNYLVTTAPSVHFLQIPTTGTYTMVVWPEQSATFNVWLEQNAQIQPNVPYAFAATVNGQSKRLMFNTTPTQSFGIGFSGLSVSQANYDILSMIQDADGLTLTSGSCQPSSQTTCSLNLPAFAVNQGNATFPAPGWRQLIVTSQSGTTSKASIVLTPDVVQPIAVNNAATMQLATMGQNGDQTFNGKAGQFLSLNVTAQTTTPSNNSITYTVYDPTGTQIFSDAISTGQVFNLPQLQLTGPYTLYVVPYEGMTASVNDTLLLDASAAATVNGAGVVVSSNVATQNAYVTFQAVQGKSYTVSGVCSSSDGYTSINVTDPSGNTVAEGNCGSTTSDASLSSAATSGTYTAILQDNAPFSGTVTVTQP
ncbi:IPT/TIG domain-containing protein [Dyella caseinilytica]|uniref:IPT/TIG domain-containing protein n=1 Tax=Dyella caseinilytica TaxID=1849581 RepID=A0ABX7GXU5_9GAMM|nr:IPT/TIG domain-containing protein [Dyella caseinilytica]QRN55312.1 IPT/TIG domain-containing protein [Dyella caseinilytica]GGA00892.1 hypothetical protein GCM10011408_22390 [Dyella caseinilytica]